MSDQKIGKVTIKSSPQPSLTNNVSSVSVRVNDQNTQRINTIQYGGAGGASGVTGQQAFDRANSSYNHANTGYIQANNAASFANGAFARANSAYNFANTLASSSGSFDRANAAFARANSAYDQANTGASFANSAFARANAAFEIANSDPSFANGAFTTANAAFNQANNSFNQANNAFNSANNRVLRAGDTMTGLLKFNTDGNTIVGPVQYAPGIDLFSDSPNGYSQLNWANTNFVWVDSNYVVGYTSNTYFELNENAKHFQVFVPGKDLQLSEQEGFVLNSDATINGLANVANKLSVGPGNYTLLPNLIAQFTGNSDYYSQINQQNLSGNGSGDIVVTADNGTDLVNYIDMGIAGSTYINITPNAFPTSYPNDGYLYMVGNPGANFGGNLVIGTAGSGAFADITFIQGPYFQQSVKFVYGDGVEILHGLRANSIVDGTYNLKDYTSLVYNYANTISYNVSLSYAQANAAFDAANNAGQYAQPAYNQANNAYNVANAAFSQANNSFNVANAAFLKANTDQRYLVLSNSSTYLDGSTANVWGGSFSSGLRNVWAGVYNSNNSTALFTFASGGSNVMSVQMDGSLFVGEGFVTDALGVLPSYGGWIVAASGIKSVYNIYAGYDIQADGNLITNGYVQFSDGTRQYSSANSAASFANGAFTAANSAGSFANSAYAFANTGYTQANNAASFANGAFDRANSAYGFANTVYSSYAYPAYINAASAQSFANGAFTQANNAASFANGAFSRANSAYDQANSAASFANGAFTLANTKFNSSGGTISGDVSVSGNLFVAGSVTTVNTQQLLVRDNIITLDSTIPVTVPAPSIDSGIEINRGLYQNTQLVWSEVAGAWRMSDGNTFASIASANLTQAAFGQANNAFNVANAAFLQANNSFNVTNVSFGVANSASSFANGAFTQANNAASFANGAFTQANNAASFANGAFARANSAYAFANTGYTQANNAASFANSAFTKANNALANTTGTFAGDLYFTGNVSTPANVTANYFVTNGSAGIITGANVIYSNTFVASVAYQFPDGTLQTTAASANIASASFQQANNAFNVANAAFAQANNSFNVTNVAFGVANSAASFANGAFTSANNAGSFANSAYAFANTGYTQANNASSFANGAFVTANSGASFANGAFARANSAYDFANTGYTQANNAASFANGAFARANSAYDFANTGYTQANNAASFANGAFVTSNSAASFANGSFVTANSAASFANGAFTQANNAASFANGAFVRANSAFAQANNSFNVANAAFSQANNSFNVANVAYTAANNAGSFANSAYASANVKARVWESDTPPTANNYDLWLDSSNGVTYMYATSNGVSTWVEFGPIGTPLSNLGDFTFNSQTMTGSYANQDVIIYQMGTGNIVLRSANTVAGNLIPNTAFSNIGTVANPWNKIVAANVTTSNVSVTGVVQVNNSTFLATSAAVSITGSSSGFIQTPSNDGYMLHITGKDNIPTRTVIDSFGPANTYSLIAGRHARGTPDAPSAVQTGDVLLRLAGNGYGTTGFAPLGTARIDIVASENYTDTARGSQIKFYNVTQGTNTVNEIASFNADSVQFNGTITAGGGFAYTSRSNTSNSATQTINFATDSSIRLTMNKDITISFTNYTTGKIVDLIVQNLDNNQHNFYHGTTANNSSKGTIYTAVPSNSLLYCRYICYDGDLANTFAVITIG